MSDGRLRIPVGHGHALPVYGVPANGAINGAAVSFEVAAYYGFILPAEAVIRELGGQPLVGKIIFGSYYKPGSVLVNAVDYARAALAAYAGEAVPAVIKQGVDQGAVRVPRGGMHHQSPLLVDHDQIAVLVDDLQGNVLGLQGQLRRVRQEDVIALPGGTAKILFKGFSVQGDGALFQKLLNLTAAEAFQIAGEESVDALAALLCFHVDGKIIHSYVLLELVEYIVQIKFAVG